MFLKNYLICALASFLAFFGISANATSVFPAEVGTAFTTLSASVTEVLGLIWPIAIALTVGFILLGLFKKAAHKAV